MVGALRTVQSCATEYESLSHHETTSHLNAQPVEPAPPVQHIQVLESQVAILSAVVILMEIQQAL